MFICFFRVEIAGEEYTISKTKYFSQFNSHFFFLFSRRENKTKTNKNMSSASSTNKKKTAASGRVSSAAATKPQNIGDAAASTNDDDDVSKYTKLSDRDHILLRSDTYIGSTETVDTDVFLWDDGAKRIVKRSAHVNFGIYKIVDEVLVNARDQYVRTDQAIAAGGAAAKDQKPVTKIDVVITTGVDGGLGGGKCRISVTNDGTGLPVIKHPEHDLFIPEMVFGHLRTGENYQDDKLRTVGGRNGLGSKLTMIFSTWARITTVDHVRGLKYSQVFRDNLSVIDPPVISKLSVSAAAKPFTCVEFEPDLPRFLAGHTTDEGRLPDDMMALLVRRVYDLCVVTEKVKVSLNGSVLPIKTFKQYIDLYRYPGGGDGGEADPGPLPAPIYEMPSPRWEYAVVHSPTNEFQHVSFVNGIATRLGGKHVDYILTQIVRKVQANIEKRKKIAVPPNTIKEQIMLFLRCDIENPSFDSQSKDTLTLPVAKFGSSCVVSDGFCEKVTKMVMERALLVSAAREDAVAKKTDGSKKRTISGIENFMDANWAGTANKSDQCTLILCEGLSAMAGVMSGLSSEDRNQLGIYPLKGKVLNVRGENAKRVSENKEIADLKKILALEKGREYASIDDVKTRLRYGKIMILTDADHDGSHIKALLLNLFQCEWPSLFKIQGFLSYMNTPILRASRRGQPTLSFYGMEAFERWRETIGPAAAAGWTVKYYKGLGTSTKNEWKEYFETKRVVDFTYTGPAADDHVDRIFNKKRANERKLWLENYDKKAALDSLTTVVPYELFLDKELIHFSVYDCERSIPNLVDGLKISLRKILFAAFKRRLTREIKVAQFSGYVSEHACYHHGEASLNGAIKAMAQNFVGANNIHLLEPNGQFGSRLRGGDDSASERYIFTQLSPLARLLFPETDDPILTFLEDDGTVVEPEFYLPILPFVLINGAAGIGTGFSCNVPPHNPVELVKYLRWKLGHVQGAEDAEAPPILKPYYEGFLGTVEPVEETAAAAAAAAPGAAKYLVSGLYTVTGPDKVTITELPVGTWTMPYLTYLETLKVGGGGGGGGANGNGADAAGDGILKEIQNMSTDSRVCIHLTFSRGRLEELLADDAAKFMKLLKLSTTVTTSNMTLFSPELKLKKYATVYDIVDEYFVVRLEGYAKRKTMQMGILEKQIRRETNKAKYIQLVLDGNIDLRRKTAAQVEEMLLSFGLEPLSMSMSMSSATTGTPAEEGDVEDKSAAKPDGAVGLSFKYLTRMPMDTVSLENVEALMKHKASLETTYGILAAKTPTDLWIEDLDMFEKTWEARAKNGDDVMAGNADRDADGIHTSRKKPTVASKKRPSSAASASAASKKNKKSTTTTTALVQSTLKF
jgi:DNA topoisomerase-2